MAGKTKIAILGGGLGSMTAAYYLTNDPGWDRRYEITVYQMGWRLGGKGASGRNVRPGYGHRIEEHGLHIWFGFYENGFRMMRDIYAKLRELDPAPVATYSDWNEAFAPHSLVTFEDWYEGEFSHWPILFPLNDGTPGVGPVLDLWDAFQLMLGYLRELLEGHLDGAESPAAETRALPAWAQEMLGGGAEASALGLLRAAHELSKKLPHAEKHTPEHRSLLADLIRGYLDVLWAWARNHLDDTETRRMFELQDLGGTIAIGILRQELLSKGFERADDRDWVDWLRHFGAQDITTGSAPVRTIYDLVFGFRGGDTAKPDFAAGTCVRGILRMLFTYKGALMFEMQNGMGDTIFTPLYGILKARGVRFEFFHEVEAIRRDPNEPDAIGEIDVAQQVKLAEGVDSYWPLIRVQGYDCWPAEPDYDQIEDGEKLRDDPYDPGHPYNLESWWTSWEPVGRRTLERGEDFDVVVCGIPVDALRYVATDLMDADARFRAMVQDVRTVQTQGVQLWLRPTTKQLGWTIPEWAIEQEQQAGVPMGLSGLAGGYAQSLDTWCDMSHLLPVEDWPGADAPGSVQYLCGPFKDAPGEHPFSEHGFPRAERQRLERLGRAWIADHAGHLWPNGTTPQHPNGLDPALLIDPEGGQGESRLSSQWWRANIDPNERYTLSVHRSTDKRLAPNDSGFSNLYLAGDWTLNGVLNAGCVEATVASGMEASKALSGRPDTIVGGNLPIDQGSSDDG